MTSHTLIHISRCTPEVNLVSAICVVKPSAIVLALEDMRWPILERNLMNAISVGMPLFKALTLENTIWLTLERSRMNVISVEKLEGHGNPLQNSCLQNSMNRGAWWGCQESDTTEWLTLSVSLHCVVILYPHSVLILQRDEISLEMLLLNSSV